MPQNHSNQRKNKGHRRRKHVRAKVSHPVKISQQQIQSFVKRLNTDRRFDFLKSTKIPKPNYASIKIVQTLINRKELHEATAIGINAFATYRIHILKYIFQLKNAALRICYEKENDVDGLVLATVVFRIFNTALNRLENINRANIRKIMNFSNKIFRTHERNIHLNSKPILNEMRLRLNSYEKKVAQARDAIRVSLSLIYVLDKKGISAESISKRMKIY